MDVIPSVRLRIWRLTGTTGPPCPMSWCARPHPGPGRYAPWHVLAPQPHNTATWRLGVPSSFTASSNSHFLTAGTSLCTLKRHVFPSVQPTWEIPESPSSHPSLTLHPIHTSPGKGSKRSWLVFQTCRFLATLQLATVSGMMNGRARDKQRKVKTPKPSAMCKVDTWGLCKPIQWSTEKHY